MKISIFAYSNKACETAERVADALREISTARCDIKCYTVEKYLREGFGLISKADEPKESDNGIHKINYCKAFLESDAFISIGSCGIAVRHIAPFVKDKTKDPAVIVIDELGKYVIPILSGHIGGANRLANELSEKLGAEAVITTATDINGRFSVDTWAAENGYVIDSMKIAKAVSAEILERDVPIASELPIVGELPSGVIAAETGAIGIYVGYKTSEPFEKTLRLVTKVLSIGLGCRRDTPKEKIADAVSKVFAENDLDMRAICRVSSIDIKKDEKGILEFCEGIGIKPEFFPAEELEKAEGDFSTSDFVKGVTGVDNVCERAAVLRGGRLIVKKTACDGVTVAVSLIEKEVRFE